MRFHQLRGRAPRANPMIVGHSDACREQADKKQNCLFHFDYNCLSDFDRKFTHFQSISQTIISFFHRPRPG
jgi:hypothetical protein